MWDQSCFGEQPPERNIETHFHIPRNKGRKEMFYLTTHSAHFIYGYIWRRLCGKGPLSVRGNLLQPHGLLFLISSKVSFISTIPQI